MAGDVGRSVEGMPGYMGYVPSWTTPLAPVGTGVTKHEPIHARRQPSQSPKNNPEGDVRDTPALGGTIPEHESFLLQKRSYGAKSMYHTDVPYFSPETANKPYTKNNPAPLSKMAQTAAKPMAFNPNTHTSVAATAGEDVLASPLAKDFYSQMTKSTQDSRANAPNNLHRFLEGKENSTKGHGGASGVDSLRQAKGAETSGPDARAPSPAFKRHDPSQQALKFSEYPAATDYLKFSGGCNAPTSYTLEFGARGFNPRDRVAGEPKEMVNTATSTDLFQGTSKAVNEHKIPPGYMGHVPQSKRNKAKMRGDRDPLRKFAKDSLMITTSNNVPGYRGHKPHSIYNDKGTSVTPNDMTTYGKASKYVAEETVEKSMNQRDHAKSHAIKEFFTKGSGDSGHVADLYYQKYRPFEGYMKCGGNDKWSSEVRK